MLRDAIPADRAGTQTAFARDIPARFDDRARWIWDDGERHPRNAWRLFRHVFDAETVTGATLTITADTRYEAYVNGVMVGRGPVRGFPDRWMVDTWSIEPHLRSGQPNTIAVLVLHPGIPMFLDLGNQAGLLAQIDGIGSAPIVTDPTWRVLDPPGQDPRSNRMSCQLGFSEFIDAREFPVGWQFPGFDATQWPAATEIAAPGEAPWPNLVLRDIPPLQEQPVRPALVERMAWVRPFPIAEVIDLRNQFDPSTLHHANHTAYSGYLVTNIRLSADDTVTAAIPWSRFNGIGIDGHWHDRAAVNHGPGSQRSITQSLTAGDHWLVIDVSRVDHGDGFQVAIDGTIPDNVSVVSPLGDGHDTAWVTIGSFTESIPSPSFRRCTHPTRSSDRGTKLEGPGGTGRAWRNRPTSSRPLRQSARSVYAGNPAARADGSLPCQRSCRRFLPATRRPFQPIKPWTPKSFSTLGESSRIHQLRRRRSPPA
jgi:hypothetical protein